MRVVRLAVCVLVCLVFVSCDSPSTYSSEDAFEGEGFVYPEGTAGHAGIPSSGLSETLPDRGVIGTDPEGTDPEGTDPEGTDPEGTDPEGTDPEGTDPEGTDPGDDVLEEVVVAQRIRIVTEESTSWVAWHEIHIMGVLEGEEAEPYNLAGLAGIGASSFEENAPPSAVADGDETKSWNAGQFPEAFVEFQFDTPIEVHTIALHVAQNPAGDSRHVIYLGEEGDLLQPMHVFDGYTEGGMWLMYSPQVGDSTGEPMTSPPVDVPDVLSGGSGVVPDDEPEDPEDGDCSGCLGGANSCTEACQGIGYGDGFCKFPGSTDQGVCCECTNDGGSNPNPGGPIPFDLDEVTWLHVDVSAWPETTNLSVTFEGPHICLNYDAQNTWPTAQIEHNSGEYMIDVVANPWVFIEHEGQWYAGTWEWLVPGSPCKGMTSVAGDHIKQPPFGPMDWKPTSGQTLYFMVSGLARFPSVTNTSERSNIVEVVWP